MTTFFTILVLHFNGVSYDYAMHSQEACGDALVVVSSDEFQSGFGAANGDRVWAQCRRTNELSGSIRPRARGEVTQ